MEIQVYTAKWCSACSKLKTFLNEKGLDYKEMDIDVHADSASLIFEDLDLSTVPQVFINGNHVGGCDDTIKYINEQHESKPVTPTGDKPYQHSLKTDTDLQKSLAASIKGLQDVCHGIAVEGGWWEKSQEAKDAQTILDANLYDEDSPIYAVLKKQANEERNPLELLALITSEVSEALEGVRKDQMDDKLPHRKMEEVELADVIVRVLDYAGGRGLDVGGALVEKLIFNTTREDHKLENRQKDGGKKY